MNEPWDGKVPLLGFPGEHHRKKSNGTVLIIPCNIGRGYIEVYAWSKSQNSGEGYNVFFSDELTRSRALRSALDVKFLVHDYINVVSTDTITSEGNTDGDEIFPSSP